MIYVHEIMKFAIIQKEFRKQIMFRGSHEKKKRIYIRDITIFKD